jgi:crotonobetainyl-CoA:carnitine CoA-transferase CaiB-like acyl-CoA transferase
VESAAERDTLAAALSTRTTAEWLDLFARHGVPTTPVRKLPDVMRAPEIRASMILPFEHPVAGRIEVFGNPIRREYLPFREHDAAPPRHGQHTVEVLQELGYAQARIEALVTHGAAKGLTSEPDL